jgi:hypothetical protein
MSAGIPALRKAQKVVPSVSGRENGLKGLAWKPTGVYSQASERQKANSG